MIAITKETLTIKDALWAAGIYNSTVRRVKNAHIRVRRSYHVYRPAETLEHYAERLVQALSPLGYAVSRIAHDTATYPKPSYYTVELHHNA